MKLVEAESEGPVEGDDALITPPRPPHRRVSVSLLLTLSVLIGQVVTIYTVFPARHNVFATRAIELHRDPPAWDLAAPSAETLGAWALGAVGKGAPVPPLPAIGAIRIDVLERHAAAIRYRVGDDEVTYVVGHAGRISPEHSELHDGELRAVTWPHGAFVCVAVGPDASASRWVDAIRNAVH